MMRKLFQTQCPVAGIIAVWFSVLFLSCDHNENGPAGYDLGKPLKRDLGKVLNEISGISFSTADTTLFSIADSKRKIIQIDLKRQKLKDHTEKFFTQSDFEDIVVLNDTFYVLISDGTILQIPMGVKDSSQTAIYPFWSMEKNDFESLYYDSSVNSLVMICKTCGEDKGKHIRSAYRFDLPLKEFDSTAFYTIREEEVKAAIKNDDADFKPSAAAIHPIENRLYILASAGQLLVVADTRGKVLEVYTLNPDVYPQAEGIAFSPSGTMYITNEGKFGKPTLLTFHYRKKQVAGKNNK